MSKPPTGSRLPKPPPVPRKRRARSASPEPVSGSDIKRSRNTSGSTRDLNKTHVGASLVRGATGGSSQDLNKTHAGSSLLRGAATRTNATTTTAKPKTNLKKAVSTTSLSAQKGPPNQANITTRRIASASATKSTNEAPKKKRAAWDVKGRLEDMEVWYGNTVKERDVLKDRMEAYNSRLEQLEQKKEQLSGTVQEKNKENTEHLETIDQLESRVRKYENDIEDNRRTHERDIGDLKNQLESSLRRYDSLDADFTASRAENGGLKTTIAQLTSAQAGIAAELDSTKTQRDQQIDLVTDCRSTIEDLRCLIREHEATIEQRDAEIRVHEGERRRMHNTIQELKGNIRVFCRVRPLLKTETTGKNQSAITHMHFPDPEHRMLEVEKVTEGSVNDTTTHGAKKGGSVDFTFDRVFEPSSTQAQVFEEISQLVQSALDGYNVCVFAYGQTGSGKTHTMEGASDGDDASQGMIPRAVTQVFDNARDLASKGWQYTFEASFVEIYNETLRDLLGDGKDNPKIEIKQAAHDVIVTNINTTMVNNETEVHALLKRAAVNRAVAETKCNERSSRSHSVFRLKVTSNNHLTEQKAEGYLNLVDLAGSERLKESCSEGQRLKETKNINSSLSHLGNVIMAISKKESHVPYRNSKLTHLLQNSLGGNSKTLMFVNVSPREDSVSETLCSLRFATKVNQCNIGTATKKVK